MSIRTATTKDIPVIQQLAEAIWYPAYGEILQPAQIAYMLRKFYSAEALQEQMTGGQEFILLLENDIPAGFAAFSQAATGIFKLNKLYVLPKLQSKGFGALLLAEVITRIASKGARSLTLNVNRYNKAKAFYERHGFVITTEEDIDIGNGYFMNDYVMVLAL